MLSALCNSRLRDYLSAQFSPENHAERTEGGEHVVDESANNLILWCYFSGWTDEKLIAHFLELGVVCKAEENLYIFKYDQLLCLKWPDHIRECR
jgi:hypothetical protein